jgi:hypothetical protein
MESLFMLSPASPYGTTEQHHEGSFNLTNPPQLSSQRPKPREPFQGKLKPSSVTKHESNIKNDSS